MKNLLAIITITLFASSCVSSGRSDELVYQAVRIDAQGSFMHEDVLDDEKPQLGGRVSYQFQPGDETPDDPNRFHGPVFQLGLGAGTARQTIDLEGVGAFDFDHDTIQADLGVRFYEDAYGGAQPFIGVGLAPTWTRFHDGASSDDAVLMGAYAEVGIDYPISKHGRLGFAYRYTGGLDGSIEGEDIDISNSALMVSLGWSF